MAYISDFQKSFDEDSRGCTLYYSNFQRAREQELKLADVTNPNPDPIVYDGTPKDYEMESFPQAYQQCETEHDQNNRLIRDRNLWNERGNVEMTEIPVYKECGPSDVTVYRSVAGDAKLEPLDGLPAIANNLRDITTESKLYNIETGGLQIFDANEGLRCADTKSRYTPSVALQRVYDATQVNPDMYYRQLNTEYETSKSVAHRPITVFRNYTKSRLRNL